MSPPSPRPALFASSAFVVGLVVLAAGCLAGGLLAAAFPVVRSLAIALLVTGGLGGFVELDTAIARNPRLFTAYHYRGKTYAALEEYWSALDTFFQRPRNHP